MTLKQLEFFLAVSKKKSLSKAALQFYLSPQALSRAIAELENEWGVPLFIRTPTGMQLTQWGECAYEEIQKVYSILARLPGELQRMRKDVKETIALTLGYGVTSSLTPDLWMGFQAEYPNIVLNITDQPDLRCEQYLLEKKADVICTLEPVDTERILFHHIKSEPFYLAVSNKHPLYRKEIVTMDDLRDCDFVNVSNAFRSYYNFIDYCKKHKFTPHIIFTSNEFNLLQEMNEQNRGIFPMPEHTIVPPSPNLRYILAPGFTWRVCVAVRKDEPLSHGVHSFIEYILKHTEKYRQDFMPALDDLG